MNVDVVVAVEECNLLFFESGGQIFAVDPLEVMRVDRPNDELPSADLVSNVSGRVLVARSPRGEFQIHVDKVLGVKRLPQSALRRPPAVAQLLGGPRADEVMGMVLDGDRPVLIVDLLALSARAQAPTANRGT